MNRRLFLSTILSLSAVVGLSACQSNAPSGTTNLPLVGTHWQATDYPGQAIQPSGLATLQIQANKEGHGVNGNSSCNQYFGQAKLDGDNLSFARMGSTKRACMDMKEERLFLTRLRQTQRYQINGNELTLLDGQTPLMVFVAKPTDK